MRGVPDVAYQASSRTGVLVYDTAPGDADSGLDLPSGDPCSAGWYVVGGTSASSPQWAGMVGHRRPDRRPRPRADQPDAVRARHRSELRHLLLRRDHRQQPGRSHRSRLPGHTGWDPVTGLGTPNAAALVPALAS